jgi:hypothetical protein
MSDNKPGTRLTEEQLQKIAGGDCSDVQYIIDNLQQNYEALIEFTSYMIERVAGK